MKKKTILVAAIAVMLVAALVVGGTLAYFTDKDNATNTFTVGNVDIQLIEQQRKLDADGNKTTELEAFQQNQHLYPIVGSAQGKDGDDQSNLDAIGVPVAKNYVDKIVTVKNTGSEAAYIRAYFAIPAALDSADPSKNVLHYNDGNRYLTAEENNNKPGWFSTAGYEWKWAETPFQATIDGIKYNVYYADFYQAVPAGETTYRFLTGVYLDKSFDMKDDGAYAFGQKLTLDEGWDWSKVSCPVFAVAVQAEGFGSASEAMDAAFGANYNPWGGAAGN